MSASHDDQHENSAAALNNWAEECRGNFNRKHAASSFKFDSDIWPFINKHGRRTAFLDFSTILAPHSSLHSSYGLALRCILAEKTEVNGTTVERERAAWRALAEVAPYQLADLRGFVAQIARLTGAVD